jgi:hypothetical protein
MRHCGRILEKGQGECGLSWNGLERRFWFRSEMCLIGSFVSVVHKWSRSEHSRHVSMVPCRRA